MLKMMNSVERIPQVIPKFKQQLIFWEEREKLFKKTDDYSISSNGSSTNISTTSQAVTVLSNDCSPSSDVPVPTANLLSEISTDNSTSDQSAFSADTNISFPDVYPIPQLPSALTKDTEDENFDKFGPHCSSRQILIDAIAHDLIETYNLFYPTRKQFNDIAIAIVKYLKLNLTSENIAIWKDALQTKLKRKRSEHANNIVVQQNRMKYSRSSSGRPVKRKLGETAARDRYKQMVMVPDNGEQSSDIQSKLERLRDPSSIDVDTQLHLWKETFYFRRQSVRDRSTTDILHDFAGYGNPLLVFEEVKVLVNIDLSDLVRRKIPVLIEKLLEDPIFITDSSPIRLIKSLCRQFEETIQHTLCDKEPLTPYPTLVCIDDRIYVFVDFNPVISTTSPDDAVALLVAMYTIFELSFDKKSRTIRFLYSVLHGDTQFLSNSIRIFIKEKNIDIRHEPCLTSSNSINTRFNNSISVVASQAQSQVEVNALDDLDNEQDQHIVNGTKKSKSSSYNSNSNFEKVTDSNECGNTISRTSSSSVNSAHETKQRQKRQRNLNIDDQNETLPNDASGNNLELSTPSHLPLNDCTNSTSTSQRIKRKRRV